MRQTSWNLRQRVYALIEHRRFEMARKELFAWLGTEPDSVEALVLMAICFAESEDFEEGMKWSRRAVMEDPESAWALANHGRMLVGAGKADQGLRILKRAHQLDPEDDSICLLISRVLHALGRRRESFDWAEMSVRLDPESNDAVVHRATLLMEHGKREEAESILRRVLQEDPTNHEVRLALGEYALSRGEHEKAEDHLRAALSLSPDSTEARDLYFEALRAKQGLYRRLIPLFIWARKWAAEDPGSRFMIGIIAALSMAMPFEFPGARWLWIPIACLVVPLALLLLAGRPLLNGILLRSRWPSLPWRERANTLTFMIGVSWGTATLALAVFFGIRHDSTIACLSLGSLIFPLSAYLGRTGQEEGAPLLIAFFVGTMVCLALALASVLLAPIDIGLRVITIIVLTLALVAWSLRRIELDA